MLHVVYHGQEFPRKIVQPRVVSMSEAARPEPLEGPVVIDCIQTQEGENVITICVQLMMDRANGLRSQVSSCT